MNQTHDWTENYCLAKYLDKGPTINNVSKILPIFDPLRKQLYYIIIWLPPPPSSAYVVYGWSPRRIEKMKFSMIAFNLLSFMLQLQHITTNWKLNGISRKTKILVISYTDDISLESQFSQTIKEKHHCAILNFLQNV